MSIFSNFHFPARRSAPLSESPEIERLTRYGTPVAGDVLVLEFVPEDASTLPLRYQTTVLAVGLRRLGVGPLRALVPGQPPNPFAMRRTKIRVSYARGSSLYRFEGRAVQCGREWTLVRPQKVLRIERRSYYRMMVETNTYYRRPGDPRDMKTYGRISNMSAGGLLLMTATLLVSGERIVVGVPAGRSGGFVDVAADVLEAAARTERGRTAYMARLRYAASGSDAITFDLREEIVAYIFEQQRLMLRTRKLMRSA